MVSHWQVGLYITAVLLPLAAFLVEFLGIGILKRLNAYIATGAIGLAFVLSLIGFVSYFASAFNSSRGLFAAHGHPATQEGPEEVVKAEKAPSPEGEAGKPTGGGHREVITWSASIPWISLGGYGEDVKPTPPLVISLGVHVDNLTVIMFLMVTFIATLIHVYSMGYMHDDPHYPRFFAYLSLFCFSMLGLVASSNIFMVFLFWELVGVCSYLLIGFWHDDKKNCDAANKAFIVNRVGDVGMLMGLGLLWTQLGTFEIQEINHSIRDEAGQLRISASADGGGDVVTMVDPETGKAKVNEVTNRPFEIPTWLLALAGLGVFAGCVGKSAQFPLHVWLPDAMAGPTPVSALIHAATMVAAGVYLVGRFYPVFTPEVLLFIAYTGGITLFIAATIAMVQTDYKKVLAYSTVSQLGFMMLGLGVGGWAAGLFHLLTHAFFKALLFLGAGSVYHSVHTYEMPVLGGLWKKMRITAITMGVGTLAISGVPFFSGFYSKDAILAASIYRVFQTEGGLVHILLFLLPTVGAAITAFYMFRMWLLVFAGEPRGFPAVAHSHDNLHGHDSHAPGHDAHAPAASHSHDEHHGNPYDHAHESPPIMTWPLILLAIPAVVVGWTFYLGLPLGALGVPIGEPVLEQLLSYGEPIEGKTPASAHLMAMGASILVATAGIGGGLAFYAPALPYFFARRFSAKATAERYAAVHNFLVHKWYFDELYAAVFVRPTLSAARGLATFDKLVVDGLVNTSAAVTTLLSKLEGVFDNIAVDGVVKLVGMGVYTAGDQGRRLQTGRLRNYLMVLALGLIGLCAGVFLWVRG